MKPLLWSQRILLAVLGIAVAGASFTSGVVPSVLSDGYDKAARQVVAAETSDVRDLTIAGQFSNTDPDVTKANPLAVDSEIPQLAHTFQQWLPHRLAAVTGPPDYSAATPLLGVGPLRALTLARSPGEEPRITYVAGRPPQDGRPVEVALAARAAAKLGLRAGQTVQLRGENTAVPVRISGLYAPRSAADPYWKPHPDSLDAVPRTLPRDVQITTTRAVLAADGYQTLFKGGMGFTYTFHFPVAGDRVHGGDLGGLATDIDGYRVQVADLRLPGGQFHLSTGLDGLLRQELARQRLASTVLNVALGGLGAVVLGVLVLGCVVLLERLHGGLTTMRARGASVRFLAGLCGAVAGSVAVPASAAGYLCAVLAGASWSSAAAGPLAVAATVVLGAALPAGWQHRRQKAGDARQDFAAGRVAPRRLVVELLVAALALIGVVLLRRRGLAPGDPFLTVVPVLLAVAAGIVTLRALPYPLRLSGRLARRTRSAVPFLGLARAARQRPAAGLPLVTMLLAMAVAAFALTLDAGLRHAQETAARQAVGGDAQVSGTAIQPAQVARLRSVPGVRSAVPARVVGNAQLITGPVLRVVTVIGMDHAGGGALLSPALAREVSADKVSASWESVGPFTYTVSGTISTFPGQSPDAEYIVVPYQATGGWATTVFLRGAHLSPGTLRTAAAGLSVRTMAQTRASLTGQPLVGLVHSGFGYGGLAAAALGAVALALALAIEAEARGATRSYLTLLGLGRGQLRRLTLVELGPLVVGTALVGWLLGLALPPLLGSAIDLSPYTGGLSVPYRPFDPVTTAVLAGGLAVVAGIALGVDAAVGARRAGIALR